MSRCDICERDEQVTFVGASQLRDAVFDHSFDPFALGLVRSGGAGPSTFNDWKDQIVAMEVADWGLCQRCLGAITNHGLGEPAPIGVKRVKTSFQSRFTGLIRCPTCNSEFRENAIVCAQCGYNMLLAAKQVAEQSLEYFESPVRDTDGYCSDPQCPCAEVKISRGTGYLYVAPKLVEFRRNCRTLQDLEREIERMEQKTNYLVMLDLYLVSPILMCKEGARRRKLNLDVAAADARRWWETGLVPLRPTPPAGKAQQVAQSGLLKPGQAAVLSGHKGAVECLVFSPDGRRALSGGDSFVILWDIERGEEVRRFKQCFAKALAFSPNGNQAICGDRYGTLLGLDLVSGEEVFSIPTGDYDPAKAQAVGVSPDGRYALAGDMKGKVRLFDLVSRRQVRKFGGWFSGHHEPVHCVVFSSDGRRFLTSALNNVMLWEMENGQQILFFQGHYPGFAQAGFLADGHGAYSLSNDGVVQFWKLTSQKEVRRLSMGSDNKQKIYSDASITNDGRRVVWVDYRGCINLTVWDLESGTRKDQVIGSTGEGAFPRTVAISPGGRRALVGYKDAKILLFELDDKGGTQR